MAEEDLPEHVIATCRYLFGNMGEDLDKMTVPVEAYGRKTSLEEPWQAVLSVHATKWEEISPQITWLYSLFKELDDHFLKKPADGWKDPNAVFWSSKYHSLQDQIIALARQICGADK